MPQLPTLFHTFSFLSVLVFLSFGVVLGAHYEIIGLAKINHRRPRALHPLRVSCPSHFKEKKDKNRVQTSIPSPSHLFMSATEEN
jgi:hypothetical protein